MNFLPTSSQKLIKSPKHSAPLTASTINISEKQIEHLLLDLDITKACGPDNIGNLILKSLPTLSKSLLLIYKTALLKGYYPSQWKISEVVPIYKDGDKSAIENYRPISLLCCVSKIFEKLIFDELYEIVHKHLNEAQHGFRKKKVGRHSITSFLGTFISTIR